MSIILLAKDAKSPARKIDRHWVYGGIFALTLIIPTVALYAGYLIGRHTDTGREADVTSLVQSELNAQRTEIADAKREAQENLNALTLRLAELQSRVIRLDALGERLTEMADLDKGEFDFESRPAQGGPETPTVLDQQAELDDFLASFDVLSKQLDDREQQLGVLESLLMTRNLEDEVFPAGFPAAKGWISSFFGIRTDPFTGRPARHEGIDVAGKEGSAVLAVASGVVTWSGERYGYGNLVEINHGNGYVTRYGHNSKLVVRVGDTVKKGQTIALMGSTGRSTGPHVHFEVRRNGRVVDPAKYVRTAAK